MMFSNVVIDISTENHFKVIKDRFDYARVNHDYQLSEEEIHEINFKVLQATFL